MSEEILDAKERIIRAAADLLARGGREAVSTRAVSAAAGVQAPTIYRQFGDMQGLLDAVAAETFSEYVRQKRVLEQTDDPIQDLRRGWDQHVAFGLANPGAYLLIYSAPATLADTPAKREAEVMLLALIARVAEAGRLGISVSRAARMMAAAGRGLTLLLISTLPEERDPQLADAVREAILAAITIPASSADVGKESPGVNRVASRAIALRAVLAEKPDVLSPAEQHLLGEWLDRLATANG